MTHSSSNARGTLSALSCVFAGAALAFSTGCTLPPSSPPPADPSQQGFGAAEMVAGAHVQVAKQGQWYGATILQALGDGRFLVHYDNVGNEYNEAVGPDRIKPIPGAGPARDYRPGERVLVTFQNRLLVGDVVTQLAPDSWRVHYDGFGPEAGENVSADRMRRPFTGQTAHQMGEPLTVDVNGQTLPAKVIAISAADHWVVRFDNFGPQYDQEVGADRIRTAAIVPGPPAGPAIVSPPPPPPGPPAVIAEKIGDKVDKGPEKAKPKPVDGGVGPQAGPPAVGENVLVHHHGAWFTASVVEIGAAGVKVKYPAGGEGVENPDRIVREPASLRGLQYVPGQLVVVEYKGIYVAGKVLRAEGKDYKIRFDGFGPEADEVITARRLRPR